MERINLKAYPRQEVGKEAAKRLRHQGLIPAVAYKGGNSRKIMVSAREFLQVIHTKAGENAIVNLQMENTALGKTGPQGRKDSAKSPKASPTVIIKEIQYHPVKADILHVDFNEISLTEVLAVKVPIAVKGEPQGLKEGGVLEHILWEVEVECLPTQIPESVPIDVSALNIGDSILVKDLQLPEGVKILSDPEATVITLAVPHAEEPEEAKPEEELVEPEVIMEKKPKEEEESAPAEQKKAPQPEKEKK